MVDILINGEAFVDSIGHFSLSGSHIENMAELAKLRLFPNLSSASFPDTNLDDVGLAHVAQVHTLENLNLQGTQISDDGLACLRALPNLRYLRLKDNPQLTNRCVPHLARLPRLVDLGVHETSIDQHGLEQLVGLGTLRGICVDVSYAKYTFDGLLALSARMPGCTILAKGHGEFLGGQFDGEWRE